MDRLRPVGFYTLDGRSVFGDVDLREAVSASPHQDEPRIIDYLNQGVCVAASGGYAHDYLDLTAAVGLQMNLLTDGVWEWPSYLVYYVRKYHLRLPNEFINHMISNNWILPEVSISSLEGRIVYV
jgi:hypothetical protein